LPAARADGHAIFGAVAAVGKLLGFTQSELLNSEGIARAIAQPHSIARQGAMTLLLRVHHGIVCHDAIMACLLTLKGITAPTREVLTGPGGFLSFATWETDPAALTRGLGQEWQMTHTLKKPYTACKATHASVYGLLEQMKEYRFLADDITAIHAELPPAGRIVTVPRELKWNPQTVPDCQFSLPYVLATAAYDGEIFLECYQPRLMARRNVRELMTRITAEEVADLPTAHSARVHTSLKDGRKLSKEYVYVKGHYQNPLTDAELTDKFKKCVPYSAYKLADEAVEQVIDAVFHLEDVPDVSAILVHPLTPG